MENLVIYTDGACKGNPGHGGWSYVVFAESNIIPISDIKINAENELIDLTINSWKSKRIGVSCPNVLGIGFGGNSNTTNNRMEISAIIQALKYFDMIGSDEIKIVSDSAYCVNAINLNWIDNWVKNGWISSSGSKVKNEDLLKEVWELCNNKNVQISHVKGHSGDIMNDLADKIADKASTFYQNS